LLRYEAVNEAQHCALVNGPWSSCPPQWIPNYRTTATLYSVNISTLKTSIYKTIPFFRQKGDEMFIECVKKI